MAFPEETGLEIENSGFKLIYFIEGCVKMSIDGGDTYPLSAGDVVVLPTPCRQRYSSPGGREGNRAHTLVFVFDPDAPGLSGEDAEFSRYLCETFPRPRHLKTQRRFEIWDLVARLRREGDQSTPWSRSTLEEIVKQFVFQTAELLGIHRPPPRAAGSDPAARVDRSCDEVVREVYGAKSPGRGRLVADQSLSPLFQRRLGMTYSRFVASVRVERAKEEMIHGALSLSAIARRIGFSSSSTFSRTFREVAGLSPREYQQRQHDCAFPAPLAPGVPAPPMSPATLLPSPGVWRAEGMALLCCLGGEGEARSAKLSVSLSATGETVLLASAGSRWKLTESAPELRVATLSLLPMDLKSETTLLRIPRGRDLEAVRRYAGRADLHSRLFAQSLLRTVAFDALRHLHGLEGNGNRTTGGLVAANRLPVEYAREYIHKNHARPFRPLCLSEIAWFAGVSEEHLARVFHKVTGKTVMQYLKDYRLNFAKGLLARTGKPVAEIAESAGFASAVSFCRAFKKTEGCTPGDYRSLQRIIKPG